MLEEIEPVVGNWYCHIDKGRDFMVVAVNDEEGTVDIQYFDGDLEEIDLEEWDEYDLEISEPPEDWTGPVDSVRQDDLGYED